MKVPFVHVTFSGDLFVLQGDFLKEGCYISRQNSEQLSLLPAISINGLLALTVQKDTSNRMKFKHSLKWDLVWLQFIFSCQHPHDQTDGLNSLFRDSAQELT